MQLPDINQTQAGALRSTDPSVAVQKSRAKLNVQQEVYKLADTIGEVKVQHDVTMATADYAEQVTNYKKKTADMAYATKDELKAMGILDDVDIQDADGNDMEAIPKWKWYAAGLEKTMEASVDVTGRRISSTGVRNKWETSVREQNNREIEQAMIESGNQAIKAEIEMAETEYKNAVKSGQYDKARLMLNNSPLLNMDPAMVKARELELAQAEEIGSIYERFETRDVDVIEETLDYMASEEYLNESVLGVEKRRQVRDAGYSRLVAINAADLKQRKDAGDTLRMEFETLMYTDPGRFSIQEVVAARSTLGQENYTALLKGWEAQNNSTSSKIKTPDWVMPTFQSIAYELEFGEMPEGVTYQDKYQQAVEFVNSQRVTRDPETGAYIPQASGTDLAIMNKELARLRDEPQTNIRYKAEVEALQRLILKYDPDKRGMFVPDPSTAPAYLAAVADLKSYVDREGPKADIAKWHREVAPQYMVAEAKAQFAKLPTNVQDYAVWTKDGKIDGGATDAEFNLRYKNLATKMAGAQNDRSRGEIERQMNTLEQDMALWNTYKAKQGEGYVEY